MSPPFLFPTSLSLYARYIPSHVQRWSRNSLKKKERKKRLLVFAHYTHLRERSLTFWSVGMRAHTHRSHMGVEILSRSRVICILAVWWIFMGLDVVVRAGNRECLFMREASAHWEPRARVLHALEKGFFLRVQGQSISMFSSFWQYYPRYINHTGLLF